MGKSEHYNNPASEVTSAVRSNDAYAWDRHYNVNRGYGVNGLNQLTSSGSLRLAYDGRGTRPQTAAGRSATRPRTS